MSPGFHRERHRCNQHCISAQWSDLGAQGGGSWWTLWNSWGFSVSVQPRLQVLSSAKLEFPFITVWTLFYWGLLWFTLNSCSVSSIFEQVWALFEQTKRWMTVLMLDWRKSKCSGTENFQLWQCSWQNGSLIPYRKSCVYDCICLL